MKIKEIIAMYECPSCGSIIESKRNILIDNYLDRKIELPKINKCECGRRGNFTLIDIKIEDKTSSE